MKKWLLLGAGFVSILAGCQTAGSEVEEFSHLHGLEYAHHEDAFYVATHHGLIKHADGEWIDVNKEAEKHDFMGLAILDENTMLSSGHPSHSSNLEDPLGVMKSTDQGETWEPIALYPEVDFHLLHANKGDSNQVYAIDAYNSHFYHSEDGGYSWEQVETEGLPEPIGHTYSLTSHPQFPSHVLAGTEEGVYMSLDSGQTWEEMESNSTATALESLNGDNEELMAYFVGELEGLYFSKDFGQTWESLDFTLENDMISYISQHPGQDNEIILGSMQEAIYHTSDFGDTWTQLAENGKFLP
ncbi:YCF48-related protein [Alkalihalophilus pseudofirmus]|uniref:F510_1955 family glycosylhydrolase n=1 Tax=Alkalihalophilus pseudofirmus TaxID=79885 RepID=UPI00259B53CE|nr:YCF48-related protein [Alkalihalophilus pseudofirmus]WEG15327.1 YCF48-related protein [Alkalihalophilus pseudofirmus]